MLFPFGSPPNTQGPWPRFLPGIVEGDEVGGAGRGRGGGGLREGRDQAAGFLAGS